MSNREADDALRAIQEACAKALSLPPPTAEEQLEFARQKIRESRPWEPDRCGGYIYQWNDEAGWFGDRWDGVSLKINRRGQLRGHIDYITINMDMEDVE